MSFLLLLNNLLQHLLLLLIFREILNQQYINNLTILITRFQKTSQTLFVVGLSLGDVTYPDGVVGHGGRALVDVAG